MDTVTLTSYVMLGAAALLIAYDVYVAVNDTSGDTISEIITKHSLRRPIIPFAFGVLIGHWFW
jgi:hypothetical protein